MVNKSADKSFYDKQGELQDSVWAKWYKSKQFSSYLKVTESLIRSSIKEGQRTSLELGAGSCTLSLSLSHLPMINRMICMDISADRMDSIAPKVASVIQSARSDKLEHIAGSFNDPLPFGDESIDLILFDAALHHSTSPWDLLSECRRVLRPDGLLIAQREQFLAISTYYYVLRRLLRSPEVKAGVVENAFLRAQYDYFLRARGFEPKFIGVAESIPQHVLFPLNGFVFSKWVIMARPI